LIFAKRLESIRSFLDLMTFYKSIPEFVREKTMVADVFVDHLFIIAVYFAATISMLLLFSLQSAPEKISAYALAVIWLFVIAQPISVAAASFAMRIVAGLLGSNAALGGAFIPLFRLVSLLGVLFLLLFVPFADFAKFVLSFLGLLFFAYFSFGIISELYGLSRFKTAIAAISFWFVFLFLYAGLSLILVLVISPFFEQAFGKTFAETVMQLVF